MKYKAIADSLKESFLIRKKKSFLLTALATLGLTTATMAQSVPSYVPTNGLVGWWPFNGNANDESGNNNNGTVYGATLTSDRFGNSGKAYSFDGVDDGVFVNSSTSLIFNNQQTISFWLNIPNFPNDGNEHHIVSKCGNIGTGWELTVCNYQNINTVQYRFWGNPNPLSSCTLVNIPFSSIPTNTYNNFLVKQNTDSLYFYLNGILIDKKLKLGSFDANNNIDLTFGTRDVLFNAAYPYSGILDDIGIWNRALTQQEITDLYNANICYQTVTVTDTLIINTNLVGFNPITYQNTIKIYPNPTNDHITINYGNYATLNGYQLKIINSLGQQMFQTAINQQSSYINLSNWTGNGIYFVQIIDPQGNIIDIRKIVLQ